MQNLNNLHIVIMAGGVGSRFWPASRENTPKQFLDILGTGKSLIQMTWDRFAKAIPPERIHISTHAKYTNLIKEHIPEVVEKNILTEPARKNTAPCLAYASLHIKAKDPEASILVVPSDHKILNEKAFLEAINTGNKFVTENDAILTLGMEASRPDTGYGYIKLGEEKHKEGEIEIFKLEKFTEKPDRATAISFLESGDYVWNAGIFLFNATGIVESFKSLAPQVIQPLLRNKELLGTTEEDTYIEKVYKDCPSISFDYAIMEKTEDAWCLPVNIGWSDLGTWNSLYNELSPSEEMNVANNEKNILFRQSNGNLVQLPDDKKAIIHGLENYIIIDKGDVLLIWPRDKEQEIKPLKNEIAKKWNLE